MSRTGRAAVFAALMVVPLVSIQVPASAAAGLPYTAPAYTFQPASPDGTVLLDGSIDLGQPFTARLGGSPETLTVTAAAASAGDVTLGAAIVTDVGLPSVGTTLATDTALVQPNGSVSFDFTGSGATLTKDSDYLLRLWAVSGSATVTNSSLGASGLDKYWAYIHASDLWTSGPAYALVAALTVSGTDADAPSVDAAISPPTPDGLGGWYVTTPTLTWTCGDETTYVDSCPTSGPVADGEHTYEETVWDVAGNSTVMPSFTVKVDTEAPQFTFFTGSRPTRYGWYGEPVVASLNVVDSASGVPAFDQPDTMYRTTTLDVTLTDVAGNSRSKSRTFLVDLREPSVRIPGLTKGETFNRVPDLGCRADDGDGKSASGVLSCHTKVDRLEGDRYRAVAVARDKAGNRERLTVTFFVR